MHLKVILGKEKSHNIEEIPITPTITLHLPRHDDVNAVATWLSRAFLLQHGEYVECRAASQGLD